MANNIELKTTQQHSQKGYQRKTVFILPSALVLVIAFTVSVTSASEPVTSFFEHLKEKRYENAVKLLDDDTRRQISEQKLREFIERCEKSYIRTKDGLSRVWEMQSLDLFEEPRGTDPWQVGQLQSVDPPQRKEYPGGPVWESVLRFENATLGARAIDDRNKIAGLEFYTPAEEIDPWLNSFFSGGGVLFMQRLGFDYALFIEVLDTDGKPLQRGQWRDYPIIYRQVDRIPENLSDSDRSRYWTDQEDGTHWIQYNPKYYYAQYAQLETGWKDNLFRMRGIEKGTYRIVLDTTRTNENHPDLSKGAFATLPLTFDESTKERTITPQLLRGGTLRIRVLDAETNEPIEKGWVDIRPASTPNDSVRWRVKKRDDVIYRHSVFPGRYVILPQSYGRDADDLVYTPTDEYTATVVDGEETEVVVKLSGRPRTQEELDADWPFIVSGTVCDVDGNPLDRVKVIARGDSESPPSWTTTTDAEGKFVLRIRRTNYIRPPDQRPTPEKPDRLDIQIIARKTGFVWRGIRATDGDIYGAFFDADENRIDYWGLVCFEPDPIDPKVSEDIIVLTHQPKELNIVMEPSILFRGTVLDDEQAHIPGMDFETATAPYLMPETLKEQQRPLSQFRQPARWTEYFVVDRSSNRNPRHFEIDVAPHDQSYAFCIGNFGVMTKDNTQGSAYNGSRSPIGEYDYPLRGRTGNVQYVGFTDYFLLPPVGVYDVVLRWTTTKKNGITLRRLVIESIHDGEGNSVTRNVTKKSEAPEFLFQHWTISGTVRDESGEPMDGVSVNLFRDDRSTLLQGEQTVTTTADGEYSFKMMANNFERRPKDGEFVSIRASKTGFAERNLNRKNLVFLSDVKNPSETTFVHQNFYRNETPLWVPPLESLTLDPVLRRNPLIEGILFDDAGKPLAEYKLSIECDRDEDIIRIGWKDFSAFRSIETDPHGRFRVETFPFDIQCRFALREATGGTIVPTLQTDDVVFSSGRTYRVELLLRNTPGDRRLILESVSVGEPNVESESN